MASEKFTIINARSNDRIAKYLTLSRNCSATSENINELITIGIRESIPIGIFNHNLSGIKINGRCINGAYLRNLDLSFAKLENMEFNNCDLSKSSFYNAILKNVNFYQSSCINSNFSYSTMINAIFRNVNCYKARFKKTNMREAKFMRVSLYGSTIMQSLGIENVFMDDIMMDKKTAFHMMSMIIRRESRRNF